MDGLVGIRELSARLEALARETPERVSRSWAELGQRNAIELVPSRTGRLRRTIRIGDQNGDGATVVAGGTHDVDYAADVERGTRAHEIRPRRGQALRWSASGRPRFARNVRHSGSRPKPYLVPGAQRALSDMDMAEAAIDAWNGAA